MIKTIWKYELEANSVNEIDIPKDSTILTVQLQNDKPCIWVLVNPEEETVIKKFEIFGTGHSIPCEIGIVRNYVGTFQLYSGSLVFHVFERWS